MSTYSTKMCKEPGGLPKGFSVVDLTNWRQGILWFSVSRRRISNFPNDSGTFSRLVGEGWRRLANSIRVTMKMVGRQCAIARWNWQKHATLQRASEYWIWIFGSGCPKLLGILQNWRPWRKHRLRPKILRRTSSQLDWLETLKARARFPPKGVMKLVSEKHNLNPTMSNKYPTLSVQYPTTKQQVV